MHAMSPQDASFLHIEDDVTHRHIGTVGLFCRPRRFAKNSDEAAARGPRTSTPSASSN